MMRKMAWPVWAVLGILMGGCGESGSGIQTTDQSVKQIKPETARGTGGYRLVDMPERARRSNVIADPQAGPASSYYETLRPK